MQSLSEIDTTSKRASKAAGFSWGISEEIGKAVRNLELYGLPGITNLNLYLKIKHSKEILVERTSLVSPLMGHMTGWVMCGGFPWFGGGVARLN